MQPIRTTLIALLLAPCIFTQINSPMLPEGTPVRLRLMRTLSSASANEGDKVDFQTIDDLSIGSTVIIPKGSTAIATITDAEAKKRMARGGKLSLNIDYVRLPNNDRLTLRGVQNVKGGGHTGAMTGGIVASAILLWPAAPFFLFMHGKDVTIPEGHEVTVYTSADYKLKPSEQLSADASQRTAPGTLTNADVMKLKASGLSDDLIVQRIKMSPGSYSVEPDDLAALKAAGLSDPVISAMMSATKP